MVSIVGWGFPLRFPERAAVTSASTRRTCRARPPIPSPLRAAPWRRHNRRASRTRTIPTKAVRRQDRACSTSCCASPPAQRRPGNLDFSFDDRRPTIPPATPARRSGGRRRRRQRCWSTGGGKAASPAGSNGTLQFHPANWERAADLDHVYPCPLPDDLGPACKRCPRPRCRRTWRRWSPISNAISSPAEVVGRGRRRPDEVSRARSWNGARPAFSLILFREPAPRRGVFFFEAFIRFAGRGGKHFAAFWKGYLRLALVRSRSVGHGREGRGDAEILSDRPEVSSASATSRWSRRARQRRGHRDRLRGRARQLRAS